MIHGGAQPQPQPHLHLMDESDGVTSTSPSSGVHALGNDSDARWLGILRDSEEDQECIAQALLRWSDSAMMMRGKARC